MNRVLFLCQRFVEDKMSTYLEKINHTTAIFSLMRFPKYIQISRNNVTREWHTVPMVIYKNKIKYILAHCSYINTCFANYYCTDFGEAN